MGIEYIAGVRLVDTIHGVASEEQGCVRFSCEKHCHTSQRQLIRSFLTTLGTTMFGVANQRATISLLKFGARRTPAPKRPFPVGAPARPSRAKCPTIAERLASRGQGIAP